MGKRRSSVKTVRTKKDPRVKYTKKRNQFNTLAAWEKYKKGAERRYYNKIRDRLETDLEFLGTQKGFQSTCIDTYYFSWIGSEKDVVDSILLATNDFKKRNPRKKAAIKAILTGINRNDTDENRSTQLFRMDGKGNELRPSSSFLRNSQGERRLSKKNQGVNKAIYQELAGLESLYSEFKTVVGVYIQFIYTC